MNFVSTLSKLQLSIVCALLARPRDELAQTHLQKTNNELRAKRCYVFSATEQVRPRDDDIEFLSNGKEQV